MKRKEGGFCKAVGSQFFLGGGGSEVGSTFLQREDIKQRLPAEYVRHRNIPRSGSRLRKAERWEGQMLRSVLLGRNFPVVYAGEAVVWKYVWKYVVSPNCVMLCDIRGAKRRKPTDFFLLYHHQVESFGLLIETS